MKTSREGKSTSKSTVSKPNQKEIRIRLPPSAVEKLKAMYPDSSANQAVKGFVVSRLGLEEVPTFEEGLKVYWIQHLSEGAKLGPFNMTMTARTLKVSRVTAYSKMKNSEAVNGWVIIKTANKQEV